MKTKEDILQKHFRSFSTPANNREPIETQLTLVAQAALLAMQEYAELYASSQTEQLRALANKNTDLYLNALQEVKDHLLKVDALMEENASLRKQLAAYKEQAGIEDVRPIDEIP